ncbi:MAG: nucleotidyltransferase [Dehalococcoidia bacterium]|nr:MAG: nucleotidyltransferase [Dehalococcoidia bacterium]
MYGKGSQANNTNVRRDSDVDIAVEWTETFDVNLWGDTVGMTPQQLGYVPAAVGVDPVDFRLRVERALVTEFGAASVDRTGDKAVKVLAGPTTFDADVVPCLQMRRYDRPQLFHQGHRLYPRSGGSIDNYPQQHYDNGVAKNAATGGRYKDIVRGLKRLESELVATGTLPNAYPSYLTECLVYNVPNGYFGNARLLDDLRGALSYLWGELRTLAPPESWLEMSELLFLFHGATGRSVSDAYRLVDVAWTAVGIRD